MASMADSVEKPKLAASPLPGPRRPLLSEGSQCGPSWRYLIEIENERVSQRPSSLSTSSPLFFFGATKAEKNSDVEIVFALFTFLDRSLLLPSPSLSHPREREREKR